MSYVRLEIIGNLGKDCTVNTVNGKNVINFSVAHSVKYRNKQGQEVDKTLWVDCAYWTDRVSVSNYLKKGTQVFASGSPDVRTWTDQQGNVQATMVLRVGEVHLLGKPQQSGSYQHSAGTAATTVPDPLAAPSGTPATPDFSDDLPF